MLHLLGHAAVVVVAVPAVVVAVAAVVVAVAAVAVTISVANIAVVLSSPTVVRVVVAAATVVVVISAALPGIVGGLLDEHVKDGVLLLLLLQDGWQRGGAYAAFDVMRLLTAVCVAWWASLKFVVAAA